MGIFFCFVGVFWGEVIVNVVNSRIIYLFCFLLLLVVVNFFSLILLNGYFGFSYFLRYFKYWLFLDVECR